MPLLAGVGAGLYSSVGEACSAVIKVMSSTPVVQENAAHYEKYYDIYRALYPARRPSFAAIGALAT